MSDDTEDDYVVEEELLMHTKQTLPPNCKKFWPRRYELFSKYDHGIYMTSELWFSVTPENIAILTAKIIKHLLPEATRMLDICCGAGGNTIQFAKYFDLVGAVDINPTNVYCTLHNCDVYGVGHKVWAVTGDWLQLSPENHTSWPKDISNVDFVFASPPWGGTEYTKTPGGFDLNSMQPLLLPQLAGSITKYAENFGLFLPKSSNRRHISETARLLYGPGGKARIVEIVTGNYCRGLLVLFGPRMVGGIEYEHLFGEEDEDYMEVEVEHTSTTCTK